MKWLIEEVTKVRGGKQIGDPVYRVMYSSWKTLGFYFYVTRDDPFSVFSRIVEEFTLEEAQEYVYKRRREDKTRTKTKFLDY